MRVYALPAGTLTAGRNVITVNDDDVYALGGMTGPAEAMRITFADGSSIPLGSGWRYAIAKRLNGAAPRVPWDDINGAGTLYNAMIAPLGQTHVAGIAWYQGESDTGIPGYDRRLAAIFADWRTRLGSSQAAWGVVQLSSYGAIPSAPSESGWARYATRNAWLPSATDVRASRYRTISEIHWISTLVRSMRWASGLPASCAPSSTRTPSARRGRPLRQPARAAPAWRYGSLASPGCSMRGAQRRRSASNCVTLRRARVALPRAPRSVTMA